MNNLFEIENITIKTFNHSVILVDNKGNKVAQLGKTFKTFDEAMNHFNTVDVTLNGVKMMIESVSV